MQLIALESYIVVNNEWLLFLLFIFWFPEEVSKGVPFEAYKFVPEPISDETRPKTKASQLLFLRLLSLIDQIDLALNARLLLQFLRKVVCKEMGVLPIT